MLVSILIGAHNSIVQLFLLSDEGQIDWYKDNREEYTISEKSQHDKQQVYRHDKNDNIQECSTNVLSTTIIVIDEEY